MNIKIKNITQISIFTAILCIISPLSIPLVPVPISLSSCIICIFSILFELKKTFLGILLYIIIGCIGMPVFSNFSSGFGVLLGSTGGYIVGYFFLAFFTYLGNKFGEKYFAHKILKLSVLLINIIIGNLICYTLGIFWFSYVNKTSIYTAILVGVVPFIFGDLIKIIFSIMITKALKNRLKQFL